MVEEPLRGGWREMKEEVQIQDFKRGMANCNGMAVSPW